MTLQIVLLGLLMTVLSVGRAFAIKEGMQRGYSANDVTFSSAVILVAVYFLILPLKGFGEFPPTAMAGCIVKGMFLYFSVKLAALVSKGSNSTGAFMGFIGLGIAALINSELLGENLTWLQLISCVGMGILGLIFFLRGAAKELNAKTKKLAVLFMLSIVGCITTDRFTMQYTGWYEYSFVSNFAFFIITLFTIRSVKPLQTFSFPLMWIIGLLVTVRELAIFYGYQFTGVSVGAVFINISVPIIMVMSSVIYKERTPKEQLIFGALAFALVMPLFI